MCKKSTWTIIYNSRDDHHHIAHYPNKSSMKKRWSEPNANVIEKHSEDLALKPTQDKSYTQVWKNHIEVVLIPPVAPKNTLMIDIALDQVRERRLLSMKHINTSQWRQIMVNTKFMRQDPTPDSKEFGHKSVQPLTTELIKPFKRSILSPKLSLRRHQPGERRELKELMLKLREMALKHATKLTIHMITQRNAIDRQV